MHMFLQKSVKRPADTNDTFACQAEENAASFLVHLSLGSQFHEIFCIL